jgi:hypothetical protein
MNWLDTQTKELLQKVRDEKLAPPKTAEFALILLRKGQDHQRLVEAIVQINKCSKSEAVVLARRETPVTINPDLTEDEALWGQFELICCDAISIFLRSEVVEQNDRGYLWPLFKKVLESSEFKPATVSIERVPVTEPGEKFVEQFLGGVPVKRVFPMRFTVPFKKARIMEHWAGRVGARLRLEASDAVA